LAVDLISLQTNDGREALGTEVPATLLGRADEVIEWVIICCGDFGRDWPNCDILGRQLKTTKRGDWV
jgi:hypothetical protein